MVHVSLLLGNAGGRWGRRTVWLVVASASPLVAGASPSVAWASISSASARVGEVS